MARRRWVVALITTLLVFCLAGIAHAPPSTRYVDNSVACDDGTDDSTVTPYCNVQAAVDDADSGDTIDIGPGTYPPTWAPGVVYDVGLDLTLQGAGQGVTVLDGLDTEIGIRVESGATVQLFDLTVDRGYSSGSGGGLYAVQGSKIIATDVSVTDSTAMATGGGAYAGGNSTIELNRVTIDGGEAQGTGGGGISMAGGATVLVEDSTISNCVASSTLGRGGGMVVETTGADVTIVRSVFSDNDAGYRGGGIYLHDGTGTFTVTDSTFEGNGSPGDVLDGGAIYLFLGNPTITGSLFEENQAADTGGAIANGGGILTITASTFSGNSSGTEGGAIADMMGTLADSTVTLNSSATGGGITRGGTVPAVRNSIVAGNTASVDATDCDSIDSQGYNLIGDAITCGVNGILTGNVVNQSPMLASLADNGGPTHTHAFLPGSPAIDAADPGVPDGTGTHCTETDQRGWDRDGDGGRCDMGAFEQLLCWGREIDIAGTPGDDTLTGTSGADVISGFGGRDTISGLGGDDVICGDGGNDLLYGGDGNDRLLGGMRHDTLWGGTGRDVLIGGHGSDALYGEGRRDRMRGGGYGDTFWGGRGPDRILGGPGNDVARGERHDDDLLGGGGDDVLRGGAGTDTADGGPGSDTCLAETPIACE